MVVRYKWSVCSRTTCYPLARRLWKALVSLLSRQTGTRLESISAPPPMGWASRSPKTSLWTCCVSDNCCHLIYYLLLKHFFLYYMFFLIIWYIKCALCCDTHWINLCLVGVLAGDGLCSEGPSCHKDVNTFTAIVDLSRPNFSIARAPLFQLKSAM